MIHQRNNFWSWYCRTQRPSNRKPYRPLDRSATHTYTEAHILQRRNEFWIHFYDLCDQERQKVDTKNKKRLIKSLHSDFTWIHLMDSQTGRRRKKYCPATFISYSLSPSLTWSDVAVIPLISNHIWSMASTASPQRRTHHSDSTQGYRKMTTEGLMFGSTNISSTSSNILPVTPRVPYIWVRDHR